MSFLGLFTFTAPYLPWVLLSFSALLGNDALVDCLGIAIGHLYYFLEDVYPLMTPTRKRVLATPRVITLLFTGGLGGGGGGADQHPAVNVEHEALIQRAIDDKPRQLQRMDCRHRRSSSSHRRLLNRMSRKASS
jgi:hypothetical protein